MNRSYAAGQNILLNYPKKAKKKNQKNAFSFYLDYIVKELRSEGKHFGNKSEAVPYASERWKDLTPQEKSIYEQKAKDWKVNQKQQPRSGRLDCTGQLIDNRVDMLDFTENHRKEARKQIRREWPPGKAVCDVHFYIISFQSLFELPDEEGYQPCEVACIDYTLNDGIVRVYHQFIDPGPTKIGMQAEIMLFSEKTHRIPATEFEHASGLYHIIYDELLRFIKPDKSSFNYPPLFCKVSEIRKTLYCLDWLAANAGVSNKLNRIFEVEDMAAELYAHKGLQRPSLSIIEDGCNSHMYDYESNTSCEYHEELECIHCAVLTVKKCCYWMSDNLTKIYGCKITDQHLPVRQPLSYVIIKPEIASFNDGPKQNQSQSSRSQTHDEQSGSSGYKPFDIRYRAKNDMDLSTKTSANVDSASSFQNFGLLSDKPSTNPDLYDVSSQSNHSMRGHTPRMRDNTPSIGGNIAWGNSSRTAWGNNPRMAWKVRQPFSAVENPSSQQEQCKLAANFQAGPKSAEELSASEMKSTDDKIDALSEDFQATSISTVVSSDTGDCVMADKPAQQMLGRGRGRRKRRKKK